MSSQVSPETLKEFRKNGVICLRNVFDENWVRKVSLGIERNERNPSKFGEKLGPNGEPSPSLFSSSSSPSSLSSSSYGNYFNDYLNWEQIEEFRDFVYNSPAAELAGLLMESEYSVFYHEHVLVKEAGATRVTPWHQDQAYYPIDGHKALSIWMPVDPVAESATIEFVAGSHAWGTWFHPRKFATTLNYETTSKATRDYFDVPEDRQLRDNHRIVKWSVSPGDCIVFHMKTLHGAPGNTSHRIPRRVLSTRWLGDDAVVASRPWEVSPPLQSDLKEGEKAVSREMPIVWRRH